jgi:hypothetical protein
MNGCISKCCDNTVSSLGAMIFMVFTFLLTIYPTGAFSPVWDDLLVVSQSEYPLASSRGAARSNYCDILKCVLFVEYFKQ